MGIKNLAQLVLLKDCNRILLSLLYYALTRHFEAKHRN